MQHFKKMNRNHFDLKEINPIFAALTERLN